RPPAELHRLRLRPARFPVSEKEEKAKLRVVGIATKPFQIDWLDVRQFVIQLGKRDDEIRLALIEVPRQPAARRLSPVLARTNLSKPRHGSSGRRPSKSPHLPGGVGHFSQASPGYRLTEPQQK